jgi:hypothetical protein
MMIVLQLRGRLLIAAAAFCLELLSSSSFAADAERLAKQIEPFLTSDTAVVAHLDATRIEAAPLFETVRQWTGQPKEESARHEQVFASQLKSFREAGGKEVFFLIEPTDLPFQGPLLAIPIAAESDAKIAELFKPLGLTTARQGTMLLAGKEDQVLRRPGADAPKTNLGEALEAAGDGVLQIAILPSDDHRRVAEELYPKLPEEIGGGETKQLTRSVEWLAVGIDPPPKLKLTATIGAASPEAAAKVNEIARRTFSALAQVPELKRSVPQLAELLKAAAPKVDGSRLTIILNGDRREGPTLQSVLQPALLQSRRAAMRSQSVNNLKQIALAMHMYVDPHKTFPPAYLAKDGKPLLSWRVLILPYLEQQELYKQFNLDEPWDSEHNRALLKQMPKVYQNPASKVGGEGRTVYLTPRGKDTVFPGAGGIAMKEIRDGTSNTILIVEVDDAHAVEWTRPDDWAFSAEKPSAGLGGGIDDIFNAALADGSVRSIKLNIDPRILRALFTRAGGEAIGEY